MRKSELHDVYLGDGVYASYDGYHIWLKTERDEGAHRIALEPRVFEQLLRYRDSLRERGEEASGG